MVFNQAIEATYQSLAKSITEPEIVITDAELKAAKAAMERAGYNFDKTKNSVLALRHYLEGKYLYLCGPCGTGKTCFFKALNYSGVARHEIVIFSLNANGADYLTDILDEIREHNDSELVIDDAGSESDWNGNRQDDILLRILAARERSQLRTHITTNLSKEQIEEYGERERSRLRIFEVVPMIGPDNRKPAVSLEEVAYRRALKDPKNWHLCKARCSNYEEPCHCMRGITVPPEMDDLAPDRHCREYQPIDR